MGQIQIYIAIILITIVLLVFIAGIVIFIIQYQRKNKEHEDDKKLTKMKHLSELQEATLEMQQLTMNDIGRDIHDGVGQRLTLASIYTKQLASKEFPEEMQLKISEINLIINESLQQLRTFSRELTNEVEHELELNEILQSEIEKIRNLHVCDVESNFPSAIFLSNKKAMFLIRIVQEFFQNSLKYAECKTLFISVSKSKDSLELMLKDDGKGFDVNKISQGIGLKNIKRRAEMIQASIELKSELNVGTSLNLKLPLE